MYDLVLDLWSHGEEEEHKWKICVNGLCEYLLLDSMLGHLVGKLWFWNCNKELGVLYICANPTCGFCREAYLRQWISSYASFFLSPYYSFLTVSCLVFFLKINLEFYSCYNFYVSWPCCAGFWKSKAEISSLGFSSGFSVFPTPKKIASFLENMVKVIDACPVVFGLF
jgi:hypothetical protein